MVRTPASTAVGAGLIPGWGTNIPHLLACNMAKKKKKERHLHLKINKNPLNLAFYDAPKSNPAK